MGTPKTLPSNGRAAFMIYGHCGKMNVPEIVKSLRSQGLYVGEGETVGTVRHGHICTYFKPAGKPFATLQHQIVTDDLGVVEKLLDDQSDPTSVARDILKDWLSSHAGITGVTYTKPTVVEVTENIKQDDGLVERLALGTRVEMTVSYEIDSCPMCDVVTSRSDAHDCGEVILYQESWVEKHSDGTETPCEAHGLSDKEIAVTTNSLASVSTVR